MKKISLLVSVLFCSLMLKAQWTTNTAVNTEVSSSNTTDCKTIATNDGRTWFAYFKSIPAPNYFEVRAQLLDKDGVKLLGSEGVLVNNAQHASFTTIFNAIVDDDNNLIVAFAVSTSPNTIYVNKINTSGAQVWAASGVAIPNALLPKITTLTNKDVIISWLPTTGTGNRAFMMRLDAATGSSVWGATPLTVEPQTASNRTTPGQILALSNNDFIHVFHNRTSAIGTASTLWAQRYNAAGIPQWASPVQLTNKTTAYNRDYSPVMNNDTLFIGYYAATGLRSDSYLQRLNPNGTIPWGINGSDFATDNNFYEFESYVSVDPANNTVWETSRLTDLTQGSVGAYVQKYDKATGLRQFTDNSKAIYPIATTPNMQPVGITTFSDNLPVLFLGRYNSASSQYLYASKINSTGAFVWAGDTVSLGKAPVSKLRMAITRSVNGQAVAGWVETKNTIAQPYAQPIRNNGTTGLLAPVSAFTVSNPIICRGTPVQFTSTSTGLVSSYSWSFPGGIPSSSTDQNPTVTYAANGTYSATLTVTNAGGSNTSTQTNIVTIVGIAANAGPDKFLVSGYDVTLDGSAIGTANSITWTPATALTNVNSYTPVAKPTATTTYTLTVKDDQNCVSSDDVLVTVLPYCIKPLNAFSPNGDGINDFWYVTTNGGTCISKMSVKVFNRYGSLIYENENYQNNWNGTYKGKPVADGTYYYTVMYQLIGNKQIVLTGDVTILR